MRSGVATNTVLVVAAARASNDAPRLARCRPLIRLPRSQKQSKVGWHSRESNRDVSIRIHNTRYGRQRDRERAMSFFAPLPSSHPGFPRMPSAPPAPFRFRSTALARRKCCSPSRSLQPPAPPRRRLSPLFVVAMGAAPVPTSQVGANVRERGVRILIGVCFGST